jgi:hypothetical protein
MTPLIASAAQLLPRGQVLVEAGRQGAVWRVLSGVIRLERPTRDGHVLVQLALPGDLIGVETLCAQVHACTATALLKAKVEVVVFAGELSQYTTVVKGLLQQQRQAMDMVRLRTGSIQQRLVHLLALLGQGADGRVRVLKRDELPTLREMAQIVDSANETVCRELNVLLPHKPVQGEKPARATAGRPRTRWVSSSGHPAMALAA